MTRTVSSQLRSIGDLTVQADMLADIAAQGRGQRIRMTVLKRRVRRSIPKASTFARVLAHYLDVHGQDRLFIETRKSTTLTWLLAPSDWTDGYDDATDDAVHGEEWGDP